MTAEKRYISAEHWALMLERWMEQYTILAPKSRKKGLFLEPTRSADASEIVYTGVRASQPLKSFLLPPLEEVTAPSRPSVPDYLFLGVKSCDLKALKILDMAFGGEYADPVYQARRGRSVLISTDCTDPLETCCCTWVGGQPYALEGFDLNLSCVEDGFIVETGSPKGEALLRDFEPYLQTADAEKTETVNRQRKAATRSVEAANRSFRLSAPQRQILSGSWDSDVWRKHSETCVECGACNHACPTCHCYFLDDVTRAAVVRLRGWDACQYTGYAVTAGGGTPRPHLDQRFRNRYFCKFDYLEANYGISGCTGCGRCIEACQGKIDMRPVFSELDSGPARKKAGKK